MNFNKLIKLNENPETILASCNENEKQEYFNFCLTKLKTDKKFYLSLVPEEFQEDTKILKICIDNNKATLGTKGYDVLSKTFFVNIDYSYKYTSIFNTEEESSSEIHKTIQDYKEYMLLVGDELFKEACYFGLNPPKEFLENKNYNEQAFSFDALKRETYKSTMPCYSLDEDNYECRERKKIKIKHSVEKALKSETYRQFKNAIENSYPYRRIVLFSYLDNKKESCLQYLTKYLIEENPSYSLDFLCILYFLFKKDNVDNAITNTKIPSSFKLIIKNANKKAESINTVKDIILTTSSSFLEESHYFIINTKYGYYKNNRFIELLAVPRYFYSFKDFLSELNNDLTNCNLTYLKTNLDISKYKTNESTILPIFNDKQVKRKIKLIYHEYRYEPFEVEVSFKRDSFDFIKHYRFRYFYELLSFVEGDLSNMDLLYCDGLENISDFSNINLKNASVKSEVLRLAGLKYKSVIGKGKYTNSLYENSASSENYLPSDSVNHEICGYEAIYEEGSFLYITDIHLNHLVLKKGCETLNDVKLVVHKAVGEIFKNRPNGSFTVLIGGDVASDFWLFEMFVNELKTRIVGTYDPLVVFTLGNHEIRAIKGCGVKEIYRKYNELIENAGMYLLDNCMLVHDEKYLDKDKRTRHWHIEHLKYKKYYLQNMTDEEIKECAKSSRHIIFGGVGFAGKCQEFNANNGIYEDVISREEEIKQSNEFEELYNRVEGVLSNKEVVVLTHMPKAQWHSNENYHEKFIYVSGHTHKNYYFDDGVTRLYYDNQCGYSPNRIVPKYFKKELTYNIFDEYQDGIHEIKNIDYVEFYKGKNILVNCNRDMRIYLLKKNGIHCFIGKNKSGGLTIMNGGSLSKLKLKDITFYYNNLEAQLHQIDAPYFKYRKLQDQISSFIKSINGSGYIHGAIIDIDYYNHIYLNPIDLTITPYFAYNMIEKYAYNSLESLLEEKLPTLAITYKKQINDTKEIICANNAVISKDSKETSVYYPATDIYKASKILKKMQKIKLDILAIWVPLENEVPPKKIPIIKEKKPKVNKMELRKAEIEKIAKEQVSSMSNGLVELKVYKGSYDRSWFKCLNCGYEWATRIDHFRRRGKCYRCHNIVK